MYEQQVDWNAMMLCACRKKLFRKLNVYIELHSFYDSKSLQRPKLPADRDGKKYRSFSIEGTWCSAIQKIIKKNPEIMHYS